MVRQEAVGGHRLRPSETLKSAYAWSGDLLYGLDLTPGTRSEVLIHTLETTVARAYSRRVESGALESPQS